MVKKLFIVILTVAFLPLSSADKSAVQKINPQDNLKSRLMKIMGFEDLASNVHNDGKLALYFQNDGLMGYYNPTLEYPTNSDKHYLWQMGILIGANVGGAASVSDAYEDYGGKNFSPVAGYHEGENVAMSDQPETWPSWPDGIIAGSAGWPGMAEFDYELVGTQESFWVMRDYNQAVGDEYFGTDADGGNIGQLEVACRGIQINTTTTNNILYFRYDITNKGSATLEGMRFGVLVDPDHPAHEGDEYNDDNAEFDSERNLVISYDYDNAFVGWPGVDIAYVGLEFVKTPKVNDVELGMTAYNCFTYGDMPVAGTVLGVDYETQDAAQYAFMEPGYYSPSPLVNRDIVYVASTGDFTIGPNATETVILAVMAAPTREKLVETADIAQLIYSEGFSAPSAPDKPIVNAVAGDEKVTLYWDAEPSESSADKLTGKIDFEGYRVYRSVDYGSTWGTPTDDLDTYPLGYLPVADYNKVNTEDETGFVNIAHSVAVSSAAMALVQIVPGTYSFTDNTYLINVGADQMVGVFDTKNNQALTVNVGEALIDGFAFLPADSYDPTAPVYSDGLENYSDSTSAPYSAGDYIYFGGTVVTIDGSPVDGDVYVVNTKYTEKGIESGIRHVYEDESVSNGIEYWYTVTAYDRPDLEFGYPRNETAPASTANSAANPHTVSVVPAAPVNNFIPGSMSVEPEHFAGFATGYIEVDIFDAAKINSGDYTVSIQENEDGYTFDLLKGSVVILDDQPVVDDGDVANPDLVPAVDGWRLKVFNQPTEWVDIYPESLDEAHSNYDDYYAYYVVWDYVELREDFTPYRDIAIRFETSDYQANGVDVPFSITDVTDPENEVQLHSYFDDANEDGLWSPDERLIVLETAYSEPFPTGDLEADFMSFAVTFVDPEYNYCAEDLCGFTGQDSWNGDTWIFQTNRAFTNDDSFTFSMQSGEYEEEIDLDNKVSVVPNPFIVSASWDDQEGEKQLQFVNLPEACTIDIYTIAGDHVRKLKHTSGSYEWWDLRTKSDIDVAYGVYVYHVEAKNVNGKSFETTGKILVVR